VGYPQGNRRKRDGVHQRSAVIFAPNAAELASISQFTFTAIDLPLLCRRSSNFEAKANLDTCRNRRLQMRASAGEFSLLPYFGAQRVQAVFKRVKCQL
jgi:hypothetical protein